MMFDTQADSVKQAYELLGAGIGMLIGKLIDDRFVKFETPTVWWKQIIKVLLGLAIVVMIWLGLKMVFPKDQPIFDGIRYCMMALVGVGFYPMLFKKLFKPAA